MTLYIILTVLLVLCVLMGRALLKVYGNLMVDVKTSNKKLEERARQIVMEATGCTRTEAVQVLEQAQGRAKLAIFLLISQEPLDIAKKLLAEANGNIRLAIEQAQKNPLR